MIIPQKLKAGDEIRIVAPARSLALLSEEIVSGAKAKLEEYGFVVTFSRNCSENDVFMSSSVQSRVDDLHDAFRDPDVKGILAVIGGFNSNQLLSYLDYDLIRSNPKVLCGYSDITALSNAIFAKTGLVGYSGPQFSIWAMKKENEYNLEYFQKCLMQDEHFEVMPSDTWSDDAWYIDQENRNLIKNDGFWIMNKVEVEGMIIGGNLCTLNLLQGTEFMPNIEGAILFLEDDDMAGDLFDVEFDRNLHSLIHQPGFDKVKGIVIGRFQRDAKMTIEKLRYILDTKKELRDLLIIANVDFGHTNPIITFPVGGTARIRVSADGMKLEIIKH
ncbi:LD-carboxypeptidase [Patescibacteria group bacterium]|nr:LD-carboxypeptidase [Patescibacteria group bacterium]